ncbi:MAG: M14 family metallopeptidase [Dongiaceae bacterium]
MNPIDCFSAAYAEARQKFLDAVNQEGLLLTTHLHPLKGEAGEELATDVAWAGSLLNERVLVVQSATHGVEGFCGSGIQTGLLTSGLWKERPEGVTVVFVHAVNPHGFSWLRRVNEDNVDLNRNFVDHFTADYPDNPGYRELRDLICPPDWTEDAQAHARETLDTWGREKGAMALQSAITSGQWWDKEGVFYGGRTHTWSNKMLGTVARGHAAVAKQVAMIDLHTGLGPYGYGEIINGHSSGEIGYTRAKEWYGAETTSNEDGNSASAVVHGDTARNYIYNCPNAEVTSITLEYGTQPLDAVIDSVRADNWLHMHGTLDSPQGRTIKEQIRDAFYQEHDDWKTMVHERGMDVFRRTVTGLAGT